MSLTAHLLFGKPTRLPKGRVRTHNPDHRHPGANLARNTETRLANVEKVFNAIADGHRSISAIEDATELSRSTVKKALHDLEDWPAGQRVVRIRDGNKPHQFETIPS